MLFGLVFDVVVCWDCFGCWFGGGVLLLWLVWGLCCFFLGGWSGVLVDLDTRKGDNFGDS